jgi:RNA polymerase sigma-70 factor (ECF subfamily)
MHPSAADSAETCRLLELAQAGDRGACEELLARYRPELCRFLNWRLDARLQPRVDASDVVQETQLEVFQRLADFLARRPMPFRLWLRKTAYERLLKVRKRHLLAEQRTVVREAPAPAFLRLAEYLLASGSTPSQRLDREERAVRVRRAVARLPDADREVLLRRTIEGLAFADIGSALGISAVVARKRYGRALLRLHTLLAEDGLTESQR